MIKNKWFIALLALTVSLGAAADKTNNKSPKKLDKELHQEVYSLPAPASIGMEPETKFRETGRLVAFLLLQSHYSHPKFNDELSKETFKQYVKAFDPNRSYFYANDIEQLKVYEDKFDDALRTGKIEPAYTFFEIFEERYRERYEYALKLLDKPLSFDEDEDFAYDRTEAEWATTEEELNEIWRKRVKNDALNLKLAEQNDEEVKEKLKSRYRSAIRRLSQTNSEDVFGYFMNAVSSAIDPHTAYYTPRRFENFAINMSLKLQGIGAVLTQEDQFTKIVSVVNKGPAQKSGQIHKNDKIIGVGQGDKGEMVDVIGWRNDDVVDLIRGEAGTVVRLQIIPYTDAGDGMPKVVRIVREEIKLEDQAAHSTTMEVEQDGKAYNLGVIELPSFYSEAAARDGESDGEVTSTTKDVARLIKQLEKESIDGLIIDLRNNGGGSLNEVVDLVGLFIDQGPVVQGQDSGGRLRVLEDDDGKTLYDGPLAVMVNGSSASASEIFAGAIQDYGRGVVIGENTFGKGTVQSVANLDRYLRDPEVNVGALKLTVEKFYRVTGKSTQNRGVSPDIAFPTIFDHKKYGESSYDNALAWDTIKTADFEPAGDLHDFLPYLKYRHEQRKESNEEFAFFVDDIERAKTERDNEVVSLNYEKRLAKQKENDKLRLKRENIKRKMQGLEPLAKLDKEQDEESEEDTEEQSEEPDVLLKEAGNILSDLITIQAKPELIARFEKSQKSKEL
ncbi:carboxy terminal-processing peptidase [Kangiella shandongensis]|uniref:carboxy terminal-processing peptidase n=1 Tax=Kangiella shandongensis TaxID=2763258 RepID=UPI001CBB1BAE|nr:carboxy terminal-processing peptidase [Kangiella shandongensis]